MNQFKISTLFLLVLLTHLIGCVRPPVVTPSSQAEAEKAIDRTTARLVSDEIANRLREDDRVKLRSLMESGFKEYYDDVEFNSIVDEMVGAYGRPLELEFKMDEIGRKTAIGYDKPLRKFWYAARTSKYEKGTVYLTVEIVPDGDRLASSGVALVTFPLGAPPSLIE